MSSQGAQIFLTRRNRKEIPTFEQLIQSWVWVVVSNIFYFHSYLGKIPNLTIIFQMGWNHQLDFEFHPYLRLHDSNLTGGVFQIGGEKPPTIL